MAITHSYSENSYLADQVLADLPPIKWQFHRLLLWQLIFHYYSENSYLAHQVLADLLPHQMAIIDSYSESSYLADQVLADIPPCWMLISQIPALTSSHSNPNLRTHIWLIQVLADLPPITWLFNTLLQLTAYSYSESSYLADQVLADLPPIKWQFHRLLLWQLIFHSYSENSYLADQVLADLSPPSNGNYRFLLWELIFGRPGVGRYLMLIPDSCFDHSISQIAALRSSSYFIPTLRTHIWQTRCWQIYPHQMTNGNYRFLLWELIFGWPSVGRSTPHVSQMLLWIHISFLLWELIFGTPGVGRSSPHVKWQL